MEAAMDEALRIDAGFRRVEALVGGLGSVIRGKETVLRRIVACFLAGGHLLIDDLPGLGKTTLARTLAALISADGREEERFFRRIQCTPDLLPYDITGVDVFNPDRRSFEFVRGPVFSHILLVDEINRTTPKVQSALLEAMAEGQVTIGQRSYPLERPFFVIATQNPVEMEGTYHLPLAQADRFMMRLSIGYPDNRAELAIITEDPGARIMPMVRAVCAVAEVLDMQARAAQVHCDGKLLRAVVAAAELSRRHAAVQYGISPRGGLMMARAARALALVRGRDFVTDEDMIELAPIVYAHRLRLRDARYKAADLADEFMRQALREVL